MALHHSSSAVLTAVLTVCGGGAFFAPGLHAGDRIEFSAPAIPLSVPKPEKEIKEPDRIITASDIEPEFTGETMMASPMTIVVVTPRTRARGGRDSGAYGNDGRDDPSTDAWNSTAPKRSIVTNDLSLPRGWDSSAASRLNQRRGGDALDNTRDARLFGAQDDLDRNAARLEGRLDRTFSDDSDRSLLSKVYNRHDPSLLGRLRDGRFNPSRDEKSPGATMDIYGTATAINTGPAAGHLPSSMEPADYGSSSFADQSLRRQTGDPAGAPPERMRAWDTTTSAAVQPTRSKASREKASPSRVGAPNKPAVLTKPNWPGNPY